MSEEFYPIEVIHVALTKVDGASFERFAQEMQSRLIGANFVPTGGNADGGADGVLAGLYENSSKPDSFFQASIREDIEVKIRETVVRLKQVGRTVKTLLYFTPRSISKFDLVEERLSDELDVTIRIRDRAFISTHVNDSPEARYSFRTHLSHLVAFLQQVGSSRLIPVSEHVKSPAVYTFLSQQVDRRQGDVTSLHAMIDALILWALEGTDPDKGLFMTEGEVLDKILTELPSVRSLVEGDLGPRLRSLAEKGDRKVRWYPQRNVFCLPFETRQELEVENAADVVLRDAVEANLRLRVAAGTPELSQHEVEAASAVALRALQLTFERQGLEFAAYLHEATASGDAPDVAASVTEALPLCGVHGKAATRVGPAVLVALRGVFYKSTDDERAYLQRLSNTYTLLFILNTEPRMIEFFQDMTGQFYLYVGSDQLLKALSEQYLETPDQMARNALRIASSLGATLVLTQPVLEEVVGHFRACNAEFQNYIANVEEHIDFELARQVRHIMVRSYLYARLDAPVASRPKSWPAFVQQFCTYDTLYEQEGEDDFLRYLLRAFDMDYASREELEDLTSVDDVAELSRRLERLKGKRELAENDALLAHAVFERRKQQQEISAGSEFGFSTWWLTGETSILSQTESLVKANRQARYIMRPEFLLNFVTLAPSAEASRQAFERIFPTLLGIRLAKRMSDSAFHAVLAKVEEATQFDESRRGAAIASIINKLKGDFSEAYVSPHSRSLTDSIDLVAERGR